LGSHIVVALLHAGHLVTVMSRNSAGAGALVESGAQLVQGALGDQSSIADFLAGHQAVIHNAIWWEDDDSETGAKDLQASAFLFEAAAKAGIEHLIYTSSTAVYRPFKALMTEEDELAPVDDYARTKAQSESILRGVSSLYGMKSSVVRAGPIVGPPAVPGGRVNPDRRILEMASLARTDADIAVRRGDGRQFVGASDLAQVYVRLLKRGIKGTFIAVAQEHITWEWIAREMVKSFGSSSRILAEGVKPEFVPRFDVGKLERELGVKFEAQSAVRELIRLL
jgi:UDP-glucose 4-epimerase